MAGDDPPIEIAPSSRRTTTWTITILAVLSVAMITYRALDEGDEDLKLPNAGPLHPAAIPPTLPPPPPLSSLEAARSMRVTGTIDRQAGRHRLEWQRGQRVRVVVEDSELDARLELQAPSGARLEYDPARPRDLRERHVDRPRAGRIGRARRVHPALRRALKALSENRTL